jgi:chitinase
MCVSRNYKFVILAFVFKFSKGQTPDLNLVDHYNLSSCG